MILTVTKEEIAALEEVVESTDDIYFKARGRRILNEIKARLEMQTAIARGDVSEREPFE